MGVSIDYAANKWEKKKIEINSIKEKVRFFLDNENHSELLKRLGGCLIKRFYSKEELLSYDMRENYYKFYREHTASIKNILSEFIDDKYIKELYESISENDIILHLFDNYDEYFIVCNGIEKVKITKWVPLNFINLKEDGKLLNLAIGNLSSLYGVSLSPLLLSSDYIDDYIEGTESGNYVDDVLNRKTDDIYRVFKLAMDNMEPLENDDFYEERKIRLEIVLEAVRQGAKFVYSC